MPLKTHGRPRTIGEPWNGNSSGTLLLSRYASVATTGGVPWGAITAKSPSCSTSLRVLASASWGREPSSSYTVRTRRPWMPPASLIILK